MTAIRTSYIHLLVPFFPIVVGGGGFHRWVGKLSCSSFRATERL